MRNEDSPMKNKRVFNSLEKYVAGRKIDQDIYDKLPGYYHRVADKYLSNLQMNGSTEEYLIHSRNGKKGTASSKSFRNLPLIRKTGQGK